MAEPKLTLENAKRLNRLEDFISQQERWEKENGYRGADQDELDDGLETLATAPPPEDRT